MYRFSSLLVLPKRELRNKPSINVSKNKFEHFKAHISHRVSALFVITIFFFLFHSQGNSLIGDFPLTARKTALGHNNSRIIKLVREKQRKIRPNILFLTLFHFSIFHFFIFHQYHFFSKLKCAKGKFNHLAVFKSKEIIKNNVLEIDRKSKTNNWNFII